MRRRAATGAVAIVAIWLFVHDMLGANGVTVYRAKRAEYQSLQSEINSLQKEHDAYSEQVTRLKSDPKRIEKEAREQFHYARPGEVVYVSPDRPAATPPELPPLRAEITSYNSKFTLCYSFGEFKRVFAAQHL